MTVRRRRVLQMAASAVGSLALSRLAWSQAAKPLAERLADYADHLRYDDLDPATIEQAKIVVIDTIGCGMAALDKKPVRICRDIALAPGDGVSTVIGTARRTTPDLASFANGAAFRYWDLNDIYLPKQGGSQGAHPSDHIAACLAVAEAEKASGEALITAIVLAYEINCRLVDAINLANRGWDPPVLSLPAVALAAGKLMNLTPEKLAQAVSLAINDHIPLGQTRKQTLSDWKGLADAEAGRNAVFAAMLARAGVTGPAPIFEGALGFFQLISGPADVDTNIFGGRNTEYRIHKVGLKPYAVVVHAQTSILAGMTIAKEVGDLDRIASIEIATTHRGYQMTASEPEKWSPQTRETADHSLPYVAARAMFDGDINQHSFEPAKLSDPRILAFMRKITVNPDPSLDKFEGAPPVRITAVLKDGGRIVRQVDNMPGFPGQPMTRADVERKFRSNIDTRWPRERTDAVLQSLWALDRTSELSALLGQLQV